MTANHSSCSHWPAVCPGDRPWSGPRRRGSSESTGACTRKPEAGSATAGYRCRSRTPERTLSLRRTHTDITGFSRSSVGKCGANITLHFQTSLMQLIVIIQRDVCKHEESRVYLYITWWKYWSYLFYGFILINGCDVTLEVWKNYFI